MTQLPFEPPKAVPRTSSGALLLSWVVIAALAGVLFVSSNWPQHGQPSLEIGPHPQFELPGKLSVGLAKWLPGYRSMVLAQVDQLRQGSVRDKLAHAVLAGELDGPDRAMELLEGISIDEQQGDGPRDEIGEQSSEAQGDSIVDDDAIEADDSIQLAEARNALVRVMRLRQGEHPQGLDVEGELDSDSASLLRQELGWYGELALLPPETTNGATRESLVRASSSMLLILGLYGLWFLAAVIAGIVVMIVLLAKAFTGGIRSRLTMEHGRHGLYAEMFALWMIVFLLLQIGAEALQLPMHLRLGLSAALILSSLLVLGWPVLRGATWQEVRHDLGLHCGRGLAIEVGSGLLVYCMALAMLVGGLIVSAGLMYVQHRLRPDAPPPSHPVVEALAGGGLWTFLQVVVLGVLVAPVVEETMFRGALYGHLRKSLGMAGVVLAIVISALISSFIFAAIHPQGWTLVPALMGLALGFCLGREWRGSLIPCMVAHGLHNFLTLLIGVLVLR
jgi:membrane protease YdiL (CAAX protease family)